MAIGTIVMIFSVKQLKTRMRRSESSPCGFSDRASFPGKAYIILYALLLVAAVWMFVSVYAELMSITMWRQNAQMYETDYFGKLVSEGRWVNYFVFPLLRQVNPYLSLTVSLLSLGYFGYKCALNYTKDTRFALAFALAATQVPAFYSIVGWPLVTLPTFIILAIITYLSDKVRPSVLFFLGAIFFFGALNNFYNLILLLILGKESSKGLKNCLLTLIAWGFFFVFGYAVALVMVRLLGGGWGLEIIPWRHPNPVHSWADLVKNTLRALGNLQGHFNLFGGKLFGFAMVLWGICLFRRYRKNWIEYRPAALTFVFLLAVALSCYVQVIPMGLAVYSRTAYPIWLALLALALPLFRVSRPAALVHVLLVCTVYYSSSHASVHYFATLGHTWTTQVHLMNIDPKATDVLHLCMTDQEVKKSEQSIMEKEGLKNEIAVGMGTVWRFKSAFLEAGFNTIDVDGGHCKHISPTDSNDLFRYTTRGREAYVWFNE